MKRDGRKNGENIPRYTVLITYMSLVIKARNQSVSCLSVCLIVCHCNCQYFRPSISLSVFSASVSVSWLRLSVCSCVCFSVGPSVGPFAPPSPHILYRSVRFCNEVPALLYVDSRTAPCRCATLPRCHMTHLAGGTSCPWTELWWPGRRVAPRQTPGLTRTVEANIGLPSRQSSRKHPKINGQ